MELGPVSQVTNSQADPESLACVGGADTSLGSTDGILAFLLLKETISMNLDIANDVSTVRYQQAALVVNTILVKLLQLLKESGNMHDDTVSEDVDAP